MRNALLPTVVILLGLGLYAYAQQTTTPSSTALVCAYNATPVSAVTGNFVFVQCDAAGRLIIAP